MKEIIVKSKVKITKKDWISLFKHIDLDEATMKKWHIAFEKRHPEAHHEFLEWLGIPVVEVAEIRKRSAAAG